jgi:hypothetical protein
MLSAADPPVTAAGNAVIAASGLILFATFANVLKLRWQAGHTVALIGWAVAAGVVFAFARTASPLIWAGLVALAMSAWAMLIGHAEGQRRLKR